VAGGDRDGATGEAAIRIGYTPRVSTVTATGAAGKRLAAVRRERARQTIDETLAVLAEAVDGERLPNVRAAAWLNDAVTEAAVDTNSSVFENSTTELVCPTTNRLRRHCRRLLPAASALLTFTATVLLLMSSGRSTDAVGVFGRSVAVAVWNPVSFTSPAPSVGTQIPVWLLLLAVAVPPVVTVCTVVSPKSVMEKQLTAVRGACAWFSVRGESLEVADGAASTLVEAVDTAAANGPDGATDSAAGRQIDHLPDASRSILDDRLAASPLQLTTRQSTDRHRSGLRRTLAVSLGVTVVTLLCLTAPLAGAFGSGETVITLLPAAAVVSLVLSWVGAVVMSRS
jgi:hypothetical protein